MVNSRYKFRAWDTERREMAKVIAWEEDGEITLQDSKGGIWKTVAHYIAVVMQYTGLEDKNGKEICEGDVINCTSMHDWNIPEWWNEDNSAKSVVIEDIRDIPYELFDADYQNDFEIIGNIYENPELLEVTE